MKYASNNRSITRVCCVCDINYWNGSIKIRLGGLTPTWVVIPHCHWVCSTYDRCRNSDKQTICRRTDCYDCTIIFLGCYLLRRTSLINQQYTFLWTIPFICCNRRLFWEGAYRLQLAKNRCYSVSDRWLWCRGHIHHTVVLSPRCCGGGIEKYTI